MTISESFKRFQHFNFKTNFLENKNFFQKTGVPFQLKPLRLKTYHLHSKLICQKPMFKNRIEWRLQNEPFTKSGVLPVTTLFFW